MRIPKVSIIILNWNGKRFTRNCLESIKKNTSYSNYEIIVIDQGSTDGSVEMIEKNFPEVKLVKNKENVGFSTGNNQGFRLAKGKYIMMLNNDTLVTPGWLSTLVKVMEHNEKIACVGSRIVSSLEEVKKERKRDVEEVQTVGGAAMLIRKSVIRKIGNLDAKNFSPIYGEENDWCYRARNHGYKIVIANKSVVVHLSSIAMKKCYGVGKSFFMCESHRLKAMLFNLSVLDLLRNTSMLLSILRDSIFQYKVHWLFRAYLEIFLNLKSILDERIKRKKIIKYSKRGK